MNDPALPVLDAAALRTLASRHAGPACPACAAIRALGWEALPGSFDAAALRQVGTLRQPGIDDPTLEEYHPAGTRSWSPDAPIAPAWFPYNRCDVWECTGCGRPFLRYTEYGGYYQEQRIRELLADRIVDAGLPA
jgi:hypothetical protein